MKRGKGHVKRLEKIVDRFRNRFQFCPEEVVVTDKDFRAFVRDAYEHGLIVATSEGFTVLKRQR